MRRILPFLLILAGMALAGAVGWYAGRDAVLGDIVQRGENTLRLARDRLHGQIGRYAALPQVVAEMAAVRRGLSGDPADRRRTDALLERLAGYAGTIDIYLMDADGMTVAASNWRRPMTFVGNDYGYRPYFLEARAGGRGRYHARGATTLTRGYFFASPLRGGDGRIEGVVAVKVEIETLEAGWRGEQDLIWFSDENAVIFMSSSPAMVYRTTERLSAPELDRLILSRQYERAPLLNLPGFTRSDEDGFDIWRLGEGWARLGTAAPEAVHLVEPVPGLDFDAHILLDTAPARAVGRQSGMLAAAGVLVVGLGGLLVGQRRAAFRARLALEAATKQELARQVAARTGELTRANARLETEVAERRETEAALRRAQDDLVQAGKLSALGQMSAGISHELNQPLAAIASFAENGRVLMERGRVEETRENLAQIADLTARMARIIRNLRAFSRREEARLRPVAVDRAVGDTLALMARRIEAEGARVDWIPSDLGVMGGGVRLQQVLVNLVSNALDAMRGQEEKRIEIAAQRVGGRIEITVRDHGPGLAGDGAGRIFDPFYTTKEVGEGHGLGLGLSISYGIVRSFGGAIRGTTHPGGGAVFTVTLAEAQEEAEA